MIILITSACELLLAKVLCDIKISSLFMWSSIYVVKEGFLSVVLYFEN